MNEKISFNLRCVLTFPAKRAILKEGKFMGNIGNITVINNYCESSDIMAINAGFQKKAEHSFGPYVNNYHVLQFVLSGKGTLNINTHEWKLRENTLFYLPAGVSCKYDADADDPYEYYWVSFIGTKAQQIIQNCGLSSKLPVKQMENSQVRELFEAIFRNIRSDSADYAYKILSDLYQLFFLISETNQDKLNPPRSVLINNALAYMDANYHLGITVEDVSKHLYMNLPYFSELFTKETGVNPSKYLMNIRMSNAMAFLQNTNMKIGKIALAVGMTPLAFTNAFKKRYRYTPQEYRRKSDKTVLND